MHCVRLFFVDGLFLHRARSSEDWSLFLAVGVLGNWLSPIVLWFANFLRAYRFLLGGNAQFSGPAQSRDCGFRGTELLIPVR